MPLLRMQFVSSSLLALGVFLLRQINAFRIIPINPQDYHLLGICWNGLYYYDRAMPMGCSSSCKTFRTFSITIEWIAQQKLNIKYIQFRLDKFSIMIDTSYFPLWNALTPLQCHPDSPNTLCKLFIMHALFVEILLFIQPFRLYIQSVQKWMVWRGDCLVINASNF